MQKVTVEFSVRRLQMKKSHIFRLHVCRDVVSSFTAAIFRLKQKDSLLYLQDDFSLNISVWHTSAKLPWNHFFHIDTSAHVTNGVTWPVDWPAKMIHSPVRVWSLQTFNSLLGTNNVLIELQKIELNHLHKHTTARRQSLEVCVVTQVSQLLPPKFVCC